MRLFVRVPWWLALLLYFIYAMLIVTVIVAFITLWALCAVINLVARVTSAAYIKYKEHHETV